jgi:hypothetical protein
MRAVKIKTESGDTVVEKRQRMKKPVSEIKEEYLQNLGRYRFLTSEQVTRINHMMGSIPKVRERLRELVAGEYINETKLATKKSVSPNIYALGARGARYLQTNFGMEIKKWYEPVELDELGSEHLWHNLQLNDFLISANRIGDVQVDWFLDKWIHDNEIEKSKIRFQVVKKWTTRENVEKEKKEWTTYKPDGVLYFRKELANGKKGGFNYFFELDRGTETETAFRDKIRSYYYAITSGVLADAFELKHIKGILWSTTSKKGDRIAMMQKHTVNVLKELNAKQSIVDLFLFSMQSDKLQGINVQETFFAPVWMGVLKDTAPVAILG